MNIDLHPDTIDDITRQNLRMIVESFRINLKEDKPMIFATDPKEDKKLIRKKIKSFLDVLDYFGNDLS